MPRTILSRIEQRPDEYRIDYGELQKGTQERFIDDTNLLLLKDFAHKVNRFHGSFKEGWTKLVWDQRDWQLPRQSPNNRSTKDFSLTFLGGVIMSISNVFTDLSQSSHESPESELHHHLAEHTSTWGCGQF